MKHSPLGEATASRTRDVLARRARALARPATVEQDDLVSLVLFGVGGVEHAVEACFVREVLRRPRLSMVPSAPDALVGVTNVRGEIIAVADLSGFLGVAAPDAPGPVIVLDGGGPSLGLLVSEVHDLVDEPAESILPVPPNEGSLRPSADSLLMGLTARAAVLSATAVLNDPRMTTTEPRSGR